MSASAPVPPPRPFFGRAVGLVLLFAAMGPAVGGAVFIPFAVFAEAGAQAAAHIGGIAGLALALIPAYLLGLLPAAFTGLAYALYDAWAPPAFPRALGAACIGALFAHLLYLWLARAGAAVDAWVRLDFGFATGDVVYDWTAGEFDASLYRALIASGAVAGFASAAAAGLLGLTTRG
jgi:hypothetical protein